MTTLAINYPAKNESNPYESTTFIPYADKLSNVVEFTGTYRKDGSPKIRHRYSPSDIKVYGSLMRRTRGQKNSRVHPKIQTIADDCNCSYGTVQRSLSKLENDLVIFIRRTGRASHYFFVPLQADGTPDENSGEYQTAKALLARKKSHSDLANCELSYNSKEIKNPIGVFLSQPEKQLAARRAALLSMVPKGLRLSLAILKLWINVALKYFADDAELVLKRTFESEKPSAYFWKVYQEKIKNPDIKKPQSLTKPPSIQNPPPNPQKSLAFKEQEKYNQELKEYSGQEMFMQQGQRQEPRKELSQAARRLMERMKRFEKQL